MIEYRSDTKWAGIVILKFAPIMGKSILDKYGRSWLLQSICMEDTGLKHGGSFWVSPNLDHGVSGIPFAKNVEPKDGELFNDFDHYIYVFSEKEAREVIEELEKKKPDCKGTEFYKYLEEIQDKKIRSLRDFLRDNDIVDAQHYAEKYYSYKEDALLKLVTNDMLPDHGSLVGELVTLIHSWDKDHFSYRVGKLNKTKYVISPLFTNSKKILSQKEYEDYINDWIVKLEEDDLVVINLKGKSTAFFCQETGKSKAFLSCVISETDIKEVHEL